MSHDRALLEATCDELLVFNGRGGVRHFHGRYSEWAGKVEAEQQQAKLAPQPTPPRAKEPPTPQPKPKTSAKPKVSLSKIEARIEQIEERIKEIDFLMMKPDVYTDGERCRDLKAERAGLQAEIEPLEREWARRAEA